jgi:signal peptidase I
VRGAGVRAALLAAGLAAGLAGVLAARRAGLAPALVRDASMRPALPPGARVAVSPLERPPARGEVVVLAHPGAAGGEDVKRVVGLPGERVRLAGGGLEIDGRAVPEPWLDPAKAGSGAGLDLTLGPDEYAVLGDARSLSLDSRAYGPVRAWQLTGLVRFAYWPVRWRPLRGRRPLPWCPPWSRPAARR